jgi:hypothetical protein
MWRENVKHKPYDEDPELGDENNLEYKEELFRTFSEMGWTPQDLKNSKDQKEYAEWLNKVKR